MYMFHLRPCFDDFRPFNLIDDLIVSQRLLYGFYPNVFPKGAQVFMETTILLLLKCSVWKDLYFFLSFLEKSNASTLSVESFKTTSDDVNQRQPEIQTK